MSSSASNTVDCPKCQRRFVWKLELAGKVVRCTCDHVFKIAQQPEADPAGARGHVELTDDDFDLMPAEQAPLPPKKCPSCNLEMKGSAQVCLNCGFDIRTGAKVKTAVRDSKTQSVQTQAINAAELVAADERSDFQESLPPAQKPLPSRSQVARALANREDDRLESVFIDRTLPIIFIGAGIILTVLTSRWQGDSLGQGFLEAGISLLIRVPVMLGALVLTANLLGISYGPLSVGLLKLAGIAMGPMALADMALAMILGATWGFGFWFAVMIYMIIAGIPISLMFDLEFHETFITVLVIVMCELLFKIFLLAVLVGLFI